MRTAIVAGATGLVGKQCLFKLLENVNYEKIYALVRKPMEIKHEKLEQMVFDYSDFERLNTLGKVDDVFCCLGTTMKVAGSKEAFYKVDFTYVVELAKYFANKQAANFMLISAIGADSTSSIFYSKVKGETENAIMAIDYKRIYIFRPSFLAGERKETRMGEMIGVGIASLIAPLLFGNAKKYKPIHAAKVAEGMISKALSGMEGKYIVESDKI